MNKGSKGSSSNIDDDSHYSNKTNQSRNPMKTQLITIGNGYNKSATNFRLVMRSLKLFSSIALNLVAVVLVIGCLSNKIVLANAHSSYEVHKHDTKEKINIGNAKTTNYNFQGSHYLPTQLTQVVLNVPKIKKSRTDRNPTVEEFALKQKILQIYQEAKNELGAPDHTLHFSHLGRIIEALNPKYIATVRVYDAAFSDPTNPSSLVPLPEMQPEYFQLDSTADPSTIPMQLDSLNLKFREYFGWDQAFINLLASFDNDLLSPDQLAFKSLLMCLSQPELCGLAGLNLHKPAMFDTEDLPSPTDSDSEYESDGEESDHNEEAVDATEHYDDKDGEDDAADDDDDNEDDDDDNHDKHDQNSVARAFVSYGNGVSPDGSLKPGILASAFAGSEQQQPEKQPEQPPPHNPYHQSSPIYPLPVMPPQSQQQEPQPTAQTSKDLYSDNENHYQKLGAATGYSPVNIYAQQSKHFPYGRSNSIPSSINKYASAIFTPPTQQQQKPTSRFTSLLSRRLSNH